MLCSGRECVVRLRDAGSRQTVALCGMLWWSAARCAGDGRRVQCAVPLRGVRPRRTAARAGSWQTAMGCVPQSAGWRPRGMHQSASLVLSRCCGVNDVTPLGTVATVLLLGVVDKFTPFAVQRQLPLRYKDDDGCLAC